MGVGFGHSYTIDGKHVPALDFGYDTDESVYKQLWADAEQDCWGSFEEYAAQMADNDREMLREDLQSIIPGETIDMTVKGRTFSVGIGLEYTYPGDGMCLVPAEDLMELYVDSIANERDGMLVDWGGARDAIDTQTLADAFELALCEFVAGHFPTIGVRTRHAGWCGTSYAPIENIVNELKGKNIMREMYTHAELQDAAGSVWVQAWNAAIAREAHENTVIGLGAVAGIDPVAESARWCATFDAAVKAFRRGYPSQAYAVACEKRDKHLKRYKTIVNELKGEESCQH